MAYKRRRDDLTISLFDLFSDDGQDISTLPIIIEENQPEETVISIQVDNYEEDIATESETAVFSNETNSVFDDLFGSYEASIENQKIEEEDYFFTSNWSVDGSFNERFKGNIEALKLLKDLRSGEEKITPFHQDVLSKYVGWGGLSSVFDKSKNIDDYELCKSLMTESEYESARSSTLDAFYTPRIVIDAIYKGLLRMGFKGGNVLEPSCGVGNFFSGMPEELRKFTKRYGVEKDSISGEIAKFLHPNANISIGVFEKACLPESFFSAVIGNVPFGDFKVVDAQYAKHNFLIHDYFIAKSLDLLSPGGLMAIVTSKGTMDKANSKAREYFAERAELIGAIRLPDNTFKRAAGTEVVSDILFFKKKDKLSFDNSAEWIKTSTNENGFETNDYFINHPEMVLGKFEVVSGPYGDRLTCKAIGDLDQLLFNAINNLPEDIFDEIRVEEEFSLSESVVPADATIKNFTYDIIKGEIYYRQNGTMTQIKSNDTQSRRIEGMCHIKRALKALIQAQLNDCTTEELKYLQYDLNSKYDSYVSTFGFISSRANRLAFEADVEYSLLASLEEIIEKNGEDVVNKAAIFYERTIAPIKAREKAESAVDAYNICMSEIGEFNLERVLNLYPKSVEEVVGELKGYIYYNPEKEHYESAEEYLSGNVRMKLEAAKKASDTDELYYENVAALTKVQPKDLDASEIEIKFGVTWIDPLDYEKFIYELINLHDAYRRDNNPNANIYNKILLSFEPITNTYSISNKNYVKYNSKNNTVYGTKRLTALEIIENLLNFRENTVRDKVVEKGVERYVVNETETVAAREKEEEIKMKFRNWIFEDFNRRERYVKFYNKTFNAVVNRKYDGSMLVLPGKNLNISLLPHQLDAVARIVRGGNTLLGHVVGAGKSFEMIASCMELKRLGLANKPIIVVPNHLTNQMAAEFLKLYPSANVLLTTKKDFEKSRRKLFISKIATGNYDAVVMGHSQFEKIQLSPVRQESYIDEEVEEINYAIEALKRETGSHSSIKQLEAQKRRLEEKMRSSLREEYKDDVITFEELGVDCLMIDEAHLYKNLSFATKMSRVAGLNPQGSKKAFDLFLKIKYLNEKNPGRNIVFATGTPVANSMAEMYIMQKYLQSDRLRELNLYHFDSWAAMFGETVTAMELAPEGGTYRQKTRFSRFVNLPELQTIFKEIADVKTIDMLPNIRRPNLVNDKYDVVECLSSSDMEAYMECLIERARKIHDHLVQPEEDNMLKICHDARLMSADMRLIDDKAAGVPGTKLYEVVEHVWNLYNETMDKKGVQAIFCDLGVPNKEGKFCVYDFIKDELIKKGMPEEEICFIHDAGDNGNKKLALYEDLNLGKKRLIIGSTEKMGTGTNIQKRLCGLHLIDVPWRPCDVEQREGRILRQGNTWDRVHIFRYVTKDTFDAYNWSIIETKQKFISQVIRGDSVGRSCDDFDEATMNYAEMKAISSGNPLIKEKMEIDMEVQRLKTLKAAFIKNHYFIEDRLYKELPMSVNKYTYDIENVSKDLETLSLHSQNEDFSIKINGAIYNKRIDAGEALMACFNSLCGVEEKIVGEYRGLAVGVSKIYTLVGIQWILQICGSHVYKTEAGYDSGEGNITRLINLVEKMESYKRSLEESLASAQKEIEVLSEEVKKGFEKENLLIEKIARQKELEVVLSA